MVKPVGGGKPPPTFQPAAPRPAAPQTLPTLQAPPTPPSSAADLHAPGHAPLWGNPTPPTSLGDLHALAQMPQHAPLWGNPTPPESVGSPGWPAPAIGNKRKASDDLWTPRMIKQSKLDLELQGVNQILRQGAVFYPEASQNAFTASQLMALRENLTPHQALAEAKTVRTHLNTMRQRSLAARQTLYGNVGSVTLQAEADGRVFYRAKHLGGGKFKQAQLLGELRPGSEGLEAQPMARLSVAITHPKIYAETQRELALAKRTAHLSRVAKISSWREVVNASNQVASIEIDAPLYPIDLFDLINGDKEKGTRKLERTPELIRGIASDMAEAIEQLHGEKLVHCDLKPENFFLRQEGGRWRAYVGDLGQTCDENTKEGGNGTFGFRAPELGKKDASLRIRKRTEDLYSLGVSLFQLLHARDPTPEDLRQQYPAGSMDELVQQLLSRSVKKRPQAAEVRARMLSVTISPT
jgi:hypothetical protein